jgi:DNA-binding phage protein
MPECHKCKFNGKGSVACLSCLGPDERHTIGHGSSRAARGRVVSLDALTEVSGGIDKNAIATKMAPLAEYLAPTPEFDCTEAEESAARRCINTLAHMSDTMALLFLGMARGNTLSQMARKLGLSRQSLYREIKALRGTAPELAKILGTADATGVPDKDDGGAQQEEFQW